MSHSIIDIPKWVVIILLSLLFPFLHTDAGLHACCQRQGRPNINSIFYGGGRGAWPTCSVVVGQSQIWLDPNWLVPHNIYRLHGFCCWLDTNSSIKIQDLHYLISFRPVPSMKRNTLMHPIINLNATSQKLYRSFSSWSKPLLLSNFSSVFFGFFILLDG